MAEERPRRPISPTLLWLSIGFFFIFIGSSQQQFQSPFWQHALGWRPVQRSYILATVYLTFGFWRLQIGWFVRAWGEKTVLLLGSASYALFCFAVWSTTSFPLLLAAAAAWGWGAAANWGTSSVLVLDVTRDQRYGTSTGLFQAASSIGFALGVIGLNAVFEATRSIDGGLGSRVIWLYAGLVTVIGVLCLFKVPAREAPTDPPSLRTQIAIMTSPRGRIGCVFLFLGGFGFGAMLSVLADHLATSLDTSHLAIAALFPLAGFFANLFGGPLSDRIGRAPAMLGTFLLSGTGLFLAWALPKSVVAMVLCALFLGFQSQLVPTLTTAMIGDSTTSARRQNAYGALFFWRDMGVAGALLVGQWLHELRDIRSALLMMGLLTVVCAVLSVALGKAEEAM